MRVTLTAVSLLTLSGCIQVYGPVKTGSAENAVASTTSTGLESTSVSQSILLGNRKPEEIFEATVRFFQSKGLSLSSKDPAAGIIAAVGSDESLASTWLDCSALEQTQNIQEHYRVVAQVWSAGEGTQVSAQVDGTAGLVTPDGNDKVKPVVCPSTGVFEKDLLETLKK